MFHTIIPDTVHPDNHGLAQLLADGAADLPTQGAIGMLLRIPGDLFARPSVRRYYIEPIMIEARVVNWTLLASDVLAWRLHVPACDRAALLAPCWIAGPIALPFDQVVRHLTEDMRRCFIEAVAHAAGRLAPVREAAGGMAGGIQL